MIGDTDESVIAVLKRQAQAVAAEVVVVSPEREYVGTVGMSGLHQRRNAVIASAVLDVLPTCMRPVAQEKAGGIAAARLPGRFDRRGKWLFDVAHNPAATAMLTAGIAQVGLERPLHGLVGLLRDKDHGAILRLLLPTLDSLWLTTPPSAPEDRRSDLHMMAQLAPGEVVVEPDFARALDGVQRGAATVLVTGSFHTVGDAMSRLPGFPPLG